jgi:muconolactone delta-isomerase
MKFLVMIKPRPVQGMTSAIVEATREIAKRNVRNGITECLYSFAGGNRSFAIVNADSGDALQDLLLKAPAAPFLEIEAHPLADGDKFLEKMIETLKKQGL